MLRWMAPAFGDSLIDVMLSISAQSKLRYGKETALASYSTGRPTLTTLDEIADQVVILQKAASDMTGHEGAYIQGMLEAFGCSAQVLQGDQLSYLEKVDRMQQISLQEIPKENFAGLAEKIERQLKELGYKGKVGEAIGHYLDDTLIPPGEVTTLAKQFLGQAKADTLSKVIQLPAGDGIDGVHGATNVFWSGYSRYDGNYRGTLNFNLDRPWSRPTFANILCHEGYPGHQAFYCRWDDLYQRGLLPLEGAYYAYNTPSNGLFEGGPEIGLHALGWDDPLVVTPGLSMEMKQSFALGRDILDLQRMYQTNGCYYVNVQGAANEEAIRYMLSGGTLSQVEAENACRFFTDPLQCTYYPAYYYGKWMVLGAYQCFEENERPEFFKILYDTPHTTNTFIQAIAEATKKPFAPFTGL